MIHTVSGGWSTDEDKSELLGIKHSDTHEDVAAGTYFGFQHRDRDSEQGKKDKEGNPGH